MRIGSGYRTLNSRPLLPSSSCPQKVRLCLYSATLRGSEGGPLFPFKVTKQDSHQPHLRLKEKGGLLENARFLSHPPGGVLDRQGWGP